MRPSGFCERAGFPASEWGEQRVQARRAGRHPRPGAPLLLVSLLERDSSTNPGNAMVLLRGTPGCQPAQSWGDCTRAGCGAQTAAECPGATFPDSNAHSWTYTAPPSTYLAGTAGSAVRQVDESSPGGFARRAGTGQRSGPC
uniref:Uncharacterized protein n=1 Tax=Rousettus aegyptiacus TaxID=9407 RepID=A0A7J8H2L1_ROUAE|nr:hypothetical protein HJG63_011451 [Rousettus aegyptiacus]